VLLVPFLKIKGPPQPGQGREAAAAAVVVEA
jgi:hypothetical protein